MPSSRMGESGALPTVSGSRGGPRRSQSRSRSVLRPKSLDRSSRSEGELVVRPDPERRRSRSRGPSTRGREFKEAESLLCDEGESFLPLKGPSSHGCNRGSSRSKGCSGSFSALRPGENGNRHVATSEIFDADDRPRSLPASTQGCGRSARSTSTPRGGRSPGPKTIRSSVDFDPPVTSPPSNRSNGRTGRSTSTPRARRSPRPEIADNKRTLTSSATSTSSSASMGRLLSISSDLRARSRSRSKSRNPGRAKNVEGTSKASASTRHLGSDQSNFTSSTASSTVSPPPPPPKPTTTLVALRKSPSSKTTQGSSSPRFPPPPKRVNSSKNLPASTGHRLSSRPINQTAPISSSRKGLSPNSNTSVGTRKSPPPPPPRRATVDDAGRKPPNLLPPPRRATVDDAGRQSPNPLPPPRRATFDDAGKQSPNPPPPPRRATDQYVNDAIVPLSISSGSKTVATSRKHLVSQMSYTDPHGDAGIYTGEVDEDSRPHGKGTMKYDNGVFYEGNWVNGKKDDDRGQMDLTRERILRGFSSWKGQKKSGNGGHVYGMDWADLRGQTGKYTGKVNTDEVPDGFGVMRYDFGLVAEGDWIKGVLNDNGPGMNMPGGMGVGGCSVAPSIHPGMTITGSGDASVVSGLGMMSICGTGSGMMMGPGYHPYVGHGPQYYAQPTPTPSYVSPYYNTAA